MTSEFERLSAEEKARRAKQVRVLILTGLGLNCEAETEAGFVAAGATCERVHLLDLLDGTSRHRLAHFHILAFVGGFAFGDHMGAGFVFANKIRYRLYDELLGFIEKGGLSLGICNGFQTMIRLGLLPGLDGDYKTPRATLAPNERPGYRDAWIRLAFESDSPCVWTRGISTMDLPTRHGEGKLVTAEGVLDRLRANKQVVARYAGPDGKPTLEWPHNPNGSADAIAALCDPSGRLFGLMPHPDAFLYSFQHPAWSRRRYSGTPIPDEGDGVAIFRNGVWAAAASLA